MLDERKLKQIEKNVPIMINEGEISRDESNKKLVKFFLENALLSLNTTKILNEISFKSDVKKRFGFIDDNFEAYLWVINTSYYSMFYMAGALLASISIKIKSEIGIHKKTFETLVYYFYLNKRIAKHYLDEFEEAQTECQELLGREEPIALMQRKAKELILKYDSEMEKRSTFTYEMGQKTKSTKAITSLERAAEFYNECLKILN
ncbi:hypothetical protein HY636_03165 [Candidatus Woesearchaeota archaeon]|nr:hypothetical protein [Candidatus Woesearchaeota archaeon]